MVQKKRDKRMLRKKKLFLKLKKKIFIYSSKSFLFKRSKISSLKKIIFEKNNKIKKTFPENHQKINENLIKTDALIKKYSFLLKKFISRFIKDGKKVKTERFYKNIFLQIALKGFSPAAIIILAINNVKPIIDIRTIKKKNKTVKVPFLLTRNQQINKSIKTLTYFSKNKRFFLKHLIEELVNSAQGKSKSVKTTAKLHKFAFSNRSNSKYRW